MSKEEKENTSYKYDSDSSSDSYIDSEEEKEIRKKFIPAHIRLRDAIKSKKDERKKGTIKYKDNYDE
jgi:hypothetical protein